MAFYTYKDGVYKEWWLYSSFCGRYWSNRPFVPKLGLLREGKRKRKAKRVHSAADKAKSPAKLIKTAFVLVALLYALLLILVK